MEWSRIDRSAVFFTMIITLLIVVAGCIEPVPTDPEPTDPVPTDLESYCGDGICQNGEPDTCSDCAVPLGSFRATYYDDAGFTNAYLARIESTIDHVWPAAPFEGMPEDNFSVIWEGRFVFEDAAYTFSIETDDGMQVFVDDELVVGSWKNQPATEYSATVDVDSGERTIRVEYYESHSEAVARVAWERAAGTDPTPDPEPTLPKNAFLASYYEGVFSVLVTERTESTIDNDWGSGAPMNGMNMDNFSVIWEGRFVFEDAAYTFSIETDDGMQVFVDDELVVGFWKNQPATEYSATVPMSAGEHVVRVEYYESHASAVARASWSLADTEDPVEPAPTTPTVILPRPSPSDETYGARPVARSKTPSTGDVFVSPSGSGTSCTQSSPCSLDTGVGRGGHIWLNPGTYSRSTQIRLGSGKTLESIDPNNKAIIDFQNGYETRISIEDNNVIRNIVVRNGYWGVYVWGNNNLIEGVISENHFYNGFQTWPRSGYTDFTNPTGASYNTFRDSIARYNNDDCCAISCGATTCSDSDADGFSFSAGAHNVIEHSEAYGNTDDGFDIWRSYASTVRNSIAYDNGYDNGVQRGNGNGFKMGSSSGPNPNDHVVANNWAYGNAAYSFVNNGGSGTDWGPLVCSESKSTCQPTIW